jgi:hypothetical protein
LGAPGRISDEELRLNAPEVLKALVEHIRKEISR